MATRYLAFGLLACFAAGCAGDGTTRLGALATDSGTVRVGSTTLRYVVQGTGTPCLVIGSRILGPRMFSADWKRRLRCVYLDDRVFTEEAQADPASPRGVTEVVADLEAARQELSIDRFVLVGHSIFGLVVLAYARQYPEHVTHVVAIGAPPEWTQAFADAGARFWEANASPGRKAQHQQNVARISLDSLARLAPGKVFIANYVAAAARYWHDSTYDASWLWAGSYVNQPLVNQLLDLADPFSFSTDTGFVSVPVYVALGRSDFAVPYTVWDGYRGPFRNLTIKVLDRAGHIPQIEDSTAFDREVLTWLTR